VTRFGELWAVLDSDTESSSSIRLESLAIAWRSPACTCHLVPFHSGLYHAVHITNKTFLQKRRHGGHSRAYKTNFISAVTGEGLES
jgi:hypothetical protein